MNYSIISALFLLLLCLESIFGDKEILTMVPVQHKKHPVVLRSSSDNTIDDTRGQFGHMLNGRELYVDLPDENDDSQDMTDPDHLRLYEEDISKRRIGSARNVRYGTWKYRLRNGIPGRGKRSVSIGNEPKSYDIDTADQYGLDEEKRRLGSALNVRYGTWQYQPGPRRSDSRLKRFNSHRRNNNSRGRVMHRWQSIWGSPGKRFDEDDTEDIIDYLLSKENDENLIEDEYNDKVESKRPMGMGPYMNWGNYFQESKRPMGMGPRVNWANYFHESKRPMGVGPHMNWANYFHESKRPMGLGPHMTWENYFKTSKRPMGMGPLTNWAHYYETKRDFEDVKEESKRPIGMGPYMKWSKYFQNKRDSGDYKDSVKRPMGMGPSMNWARYFHKRNAPDDENSSIIYKEESKRPMGVGPYTKWWKFFS